MSSYEEPTAILVMVVHGSVLLGPCVEHSRQVSETKKPCHELSTVGWGGVEGSVSSQTDLHDLTGEHNTTWVEGGVTKTLPRPQKYSM